MNSPRSRSASSCTMDDVRGCLVLSRDGLVLGAYPEEDEQAFKPAWLKFVHVGEARRGFVEFSDQLWAYVHRGPYAAFVVSGTGVRPGVMLDQLEQAVLAAEETRAKKEETLKVPDAASALPPAPPATGRSSCTGAGGANPAAPECRPSPRPGRPMAYPGRPAPIPRNCSRCRRCRSRWRRCRNSCSSRRSNSAQANGAVAPARRPSALRSLLPRRRRPGCGSAASVARQRLFRAGDGLDAPRPTTPSEADPVTPAGRPAAFATEALAVVEGRRRWRPTATGAVRVGAPLRAARVRAGRRARGSGPAGVDQRRLGRSRRRPPPAPVRGAADERPGAFRREPQRLVSPNGAPDEPDEVTEEPSEVDRVMLAKEFSGLLQLDEDGDED